MEDSKKNAQTNVTSWYAAELAELESANEQIAFYSPPPIASDQDSEGALNSEVQLFHNVPPLLPKQIHTTMDPFLALPEGVPEYERSRIQLYSQTFATTIFGASGSSRYSPTAATGIPIAMHSSVGRKWVCVLVDESLHSWRGSVERNRGLSRQRSQAYQELNKALRVRRERFQEAMMAMPVCGLVEFRFGTTRSRDMHTTATDMLIQSRGTLKDALTAAPLLEPFYISAQFGFGRCHFSTLEKLDRVKAEWEEEMETVLLSPMPPCPVAVIEDLDDHHTETCESLRTRTIEMMIESTKTITRPTIFAQSMMLNLLNEFAWTLLQFADSFELTINLLRRFEYLAKGSLVGGGSGDRSYELRASVFATILSRARRDVTACWSPGELRQADAEITAIHINTLKMFQYLKPEGRDLLLEKFTDWLHQDLMPNQQPIITKAEILELEGQIHDTWRSIQGRGT